jgi:hypothetical protein
VRWDTGQTAREERDTGVLARCATQLALARASGCGVLDTSPAVVATGQALSARRKSAMTTCWNLRSRKLDGRGSPVSQHAHRKLEGLYAVGIVAAPLGRECQRESERLGYGCEAVKPRVERWPWTSAVRSSTLMPQTFTCERQPKEAHSLHAVLGCGQAWDHSQSTSAFNFNFSVAAEVITDQ